MCLLWGKERGRFCARGPKQPRSVFALVDLAQRYAQISMVSRLWRATLNVCCHGTNQIGVRYRLPVFFARFPGDDGGRNKKGAAAVVPRRRCPSSRRQPRQTLIHIRKAFCQRRRTFGCTQFLFPHRPVK